MNEPSNRLYDLLPAFHRVRDAELGYPLRALLGVIGEQVELVEQDISRQYDNWFIETCEDWVVPYLGDLVGYRPIGSTGGGAKLRRVQSPRAAVANVIAYRRRKGTLALLELLANNSGWPSRAVEFYKLLAWTQHLSHLRLERGQTVDLSYGDALDRLNGPFDTLARGIDIRRLGSARTRGRHNVPTVATFVWPLKAYSVSRAPALRVDAVGTNCFAFSVLGNDTPLYVRPKAETDPALIANELNLPVPIRRRLLAQDLEAGAESALYGQGKSLAIYAPGWPTANAPQPVPPEAIKLADLARWKHRPKPGEILLDPVRGRMIFPKRQSPKRVWVDYHYAFGGDIGGGEYRRRLQQPAKIKIFPVRKPLKGGAAAKNALSLVIEQWRSEAEKLTRDGVGAVIEIQDSADYAESLSIDLPKGAYLQVRAAVGRRPSIRLLEQGADEIDALVISGKKGSRLVLDGLLIMGGGLQLIGPDRDDEHAVAEGDLCDLIIRHSTLVPGWSLDSHCQPKEANEPSLTLIDTGASVTIESSIIGSIEVAANEVTTDPVRIRISDSIVDATDLENQAVAASSLPFAFAELSFARTTVFGQVAVHSIELAENSIFHGAFAVARRQVGCMRFCYAPPGSRTPRRFGCQPDGVTQKPGANVASESARVRPSFMSMRYGSPNYARLALHCAPEIRRGADDGSEMGVFHDEFAPQRLDRLNADLIEYSPTEFPAEIIVAS